MSTHKAVTLVIFTCKGREHLLQKSYASFKKACSFEFSKIILAIDGQIDPTIIVQINPDVIIQHTERRGYVNSIAKALKLIDTPYFFWLEDDWAFHQQVDIALMMDYLENNKNWAEILLSQYGPLKPELKTQPLGNHLYKAPFGFSANPCLCHTHHIREAFNLLETSPKGDKLGEDGFENFLTKTFEEKNITCAILDPVEGLGITHEGYLESTPRNWHMTNSMEAKTKAHLLTIPAPTFARRVYMMLKLFATFCRLSATQLTSNKVYEYCFRIISSAKTLKKDD
jgi:hypothetical protein